MTDEPERQGGEREEGWPETPAEGVSEYEEEPTATGNSGFPRPLPEKVRQRVVELAAECLGGLPDEHIPAQLRRVARFEPRRRARLASTQIATHVEASEEFRTRVAQHVRDTQPQLAEGLEAGVPPQAADPAAVAAAAYLLRPAGWSRLVDQAENDLERQDAAAEEAAAAEEVARLKEEVAAAKESGRAEIRRLQSELRDARGEVADLRRKLRDTRDRTRRAEEEAQEARAAAEQERATASKNASSAETELRKLRGRLADAEAAAEVARRSSREGRSADDARLHVLLDALVDAAQGLRRELALPSTISRPADVAGAADSGEPGPSAPVRGLAEDDPAQLDYLLALPQLHMIVDGYNVTKTGYPALTLEEQRTRLLSGLGGLVAQSRVEVTCVFDGADLQGPVPTTAPRGVRVLFSDPGQTADDLICRLVRAEPPGRAVVVVSSDREIAEEVHRAGARPAPAMLLLRRLDRG